MRTLSQIIDEKLIPWAADSAGKRLIVARPVMKPRRLPDGVKLERRKIAGKRVVAKNERIYANVRGSSAHWPAAGLIEIEVSKLVCTLEGRAAYQVNEYLLHADEGNFILVPPGTPHPDYTSTHLQKESGPCTLLNIWPRPRAVQCSLHRIENGEHLPNDSEDYVLQDETLVRLFHLVAEEGIENSDALICQNLLTVFFQVLRRELLAGRYLRTLPKVTSDATTGKDDQFASGVHQHIQAHFHQSLTLAGVARMMFLSRASFARHVKNATGRTFGELLTHYRIEYAKQLLIESEWTSSAIAEIVGFKSPTHFHKLFVRLTGSTPGQFRAAARSSKDS